MTRVRPVVKLFGLGMLMALAGCAEPELGAEVSVTGLRVDTVLGGDVDERFLRAERPRVFNFPADHGAHPGFRSEWWYITAVLNDEDGQDYGLHFTLFRQALSPQPTGPGPWHTGTAYLAHLAVTDVAAQTHRQAQRFARGHPALADVSTTGPLQAYLEDWRLTGAGDAAQHAFELDAMAEEVGAKLSLRQTIAPVLQGEGGVSKKGPDGASYYYSMPRLQASGELLIEGTTVPVQGLAWFDREWSTSVLPAEVVGWDWFALQLDDGRSIMVYHLRRADGQRNAYDHGMLVDAAGQAVTYFNDGDFELRPVRWWSDERGDSWPVQWSLRLKSEQFDINAMLEDQVMDTSVLYWEGIVAVAQNGTRVGRGYMELTGYAGAAAD